MKIQAEIGADKHHVEIRRDGNIVFARIDDRKYELEVSEPEPNVFLVKNGGKLSQVFVSPETNLNEPVHVSIGTNEIDVRIIDLKRLRGSTTSDEEAAGRAEIKTAMPGKVVRVLVAEGDAVQKGDGVIVVEAMKMQNEMKSPKDGVVSKIKIAEGDTVSAGDILVVIE